MVPRVPPWFLLIACEQGLLVLNNFDVLQRSQYQANAQNANGAKAHHNQVDYVRVLILLAVILANTEILSCDHSGGVIPSHCLARKLHLKALRRLIRI